MKIHHYTTIDTLALILNNKTIRFNRLDMVDDLEEGNVESSGVKLGHYIFVSCWTENVEESIPLWKMYTNNGMGVRISLEEDMFKDYFLTDQKIENLQATGAMYSKLPLTEILNCEYLISPLFDKKSGFFYRNVEYVSDIHERTKNAVKIEKNEDKIKSMNISFKEIGSYKNSRWAFQEETRFVLNIMPRNSAIGFDSPELGAWFCHVYSNNIQLPFTSYYMNLKDDIFDSMEVTLSPSVTDAQKLIVEALLSKFAPKAKLNDSMLKQYVKLNK